MLQSLKDFQYDGKAALRKVIEASEYKNLPQAVAALTMFSHPETVKQTVKQSISHTRLGNFTKKREAKKSKVKNEI